VIPPIDPETRLLPPRADKSPYPTTIEEVRQVFVVDAPFPQRRAMIFAAFELYARILWMYLPNARLWLNGGFVTYKNVAPHDLDVAFLADSSDLTAVFSRESDALSLLTFQGVSAVAPNMANVKRLQPIAGLIDSFMVQADNPLAVQTWKDRWSIASTPDGDGYRRDLFKGYLEVRA